MKYFDTHCHLNLEPLTNEFEAIIQKCLQNEVYVNIVGTTLTSSQLAVKQAQSFNQLFCTVGIHPSHVYENLEFEAQIFQELETLLKNKIANKIIAVGETGLDFYRIDPNNLEQEKKHQKKWFLKQCALAKKYELPLMLHIRDAHDEILEILKTIDHYGIIHCYNQGADLAKKYLSLKGNWKIAIPGIITYKKALELVEAIKFIPLEKLLIETDAPWLAPVPYRGKTNYPYYVIENLKKIAEIKGLDLHQCQKQIWKNSLDIFQIKDKFNL